MKIYNSILGILILLTITIGCQKDDDSTIYLSDAKQITAFKILKTENPSLTQDIIGTIDQDTRTIVAMAPIGTDLNGLVPSIQVSLKASIDPKASQDFGNTVIYTVTAEDKTTAAYEVTVLITKSTEKKITYFNFTPTDNPSLTAIVVCTIEEDLKLITATIPNNVDLSSITPSIGLSPGATIDLNGVQNFTEKVNYTITAEDGSSNIYEVHLTNLATKQKKVLEDILSTNPENTLGWDLNTPDLSTLEGVNTWETGEIHWVDLSGKGIKVIPAALGELKYLSFLKLSNNNIDFIPEEIGSLTYLSSFYVDNNMLEALPAAFWTLTELRNLSLNNNNLTYIPSEVGALINLRQLNISNNNLQSFPAETGNLAQLTYLNFSSNKIETLPQEIGQLTNLQYFYATDNELTNLPESIWDLESIEYFSIGSNNFSSLTNKIGQLTTLIELNISNNNISTLPFSIGELINLDELDLRTNSFTSIPQVVCDLETDHGTLIYKDEGVSCD
ncbi:leucine-rich repeat domain-containing protein [Maribacter arenosus]|uniref:Disease resistance R13L4/SHOC-2-like LRR domain-containing protein n=1 Tax=Maribacter arenosus TaxID=1854708 RepID=A0ABR7VGS6_9FLAO|nr:hypothetical protein [Maribacter arenosus]MBD0852546.1 hypothetical protein [Maribacter arenosus]